MKKEVLVTSDLALFNHVRDEFDRQGISNKTEVMNSGSSYRRGGFLGGRGDFPTGRVGERQDLQVSYYIYVKKDQIELAKKVLGEVKSHQ